MQGRWIAGLVLGMVVAAYAGYAGAAEPWYVGADAGLGGNYRQDGDNGRLYAGYELGTAQAFGMDLVNAVEAQLYKLNYRDSRTTQGHTVYRRVRVEGGALAWAPQLKVSKDVSLNGRVGVSYNHANVRTLDSEIVNTYTRVGPMGSAGAAYALTDHVRLRADVNYLQVKSGFREISDRTMLSTGVQVQF